METIIKHNLLVCLASAWCFVSSAMVHAANTEALHFHQVKKPGDQTLYSTIPSVAYRRDGSVSKQYHPNSIIYQQRQLMRQLQAEQDELDYQTELEYQESLEKEKQQENLLESLSSSSSTSIIRNPKSDNLLEELIQLEKRGGRARAMPE